MKSKIKQVLLCLTFLLVLLIAVGCKATTHDLSTEEVEQLTILPEDLIAQLGVVSDDELTQAILQFKNNNAEAEAASLQNFLDARKEFGDIKSVSFTEIEGSKKDGYLIHAHIWGSLRESEMTIGLDKELQMISLSFAPNYTISEKIAKAGLMTMVGMSVVFAVLIFIAFIIGLFRYVNILECKLKNKNTMTNAAQSNTEIKRESPSQSLSQAMHSVTSAPILQASSTDNLVNDKELVAVITAAICSYTGQSEDGFIVRSITRVSRRKR